MITRPINIVKAVSDIPDSGKPSGSSNLMLLSGQKLSDGAKHTYIQCHFLTTLILMESEQITPTLDLTNYDMTDKIIRVLVNPNNVHKKRKCENLKQGLQYLKHKQVAHKMWWGVNFNKQVSKT
jgi:hypothetical protein